MAIGDRNEQIDALEARLQEVLAQLDLKLSSVLAGLKGASSKDLTTLEADLEALVSKHQNRSGWVCFHHSVAEAGTPEQLPSYTVPDGFAVVVKYHPDNTGRIGVGTSAANANLNTGQPEILSQKGEGVKLYVTNTNLIWVDAAVSGDKVIVYVEQ